MGDRDVETYIWHPERFEEKMSAIEMVMAATLARKLGVVEIDMKIDRKFDCVCGEGTSHLHLIGTERDNS